MGDAGGERGVTGDSTPAAIPASAWALAGGVLLVPLAMSGATLSAVEVKFLLARIAILVVSVLVLADTGRSWSALAPGFGTLALGGSLLAYCAAVCLARPYRDWLVFADLGLSLLLFVEAVVVLHDARSRCLLLASWQCATILVCAYYLIQRSGHDWGNWSLPHVVGSTFGNRNFLVMYLLCSYPFSVPLLGDRNRPIRGVAAVSLLMALLCLLLSNSRAAPLLLLLSIPAWLYYGSLQAQSPRSTRVLGVLWKAACAALLVALGAALIPLSRMSWEQANDLTHYRLQLWWETLVAVGGEPWLGHGAGTFRKLFPGFRSEALGSMFGMFSPADTSHNEVIEILFEYGVAGLALLAAVVFLATGIPGGKRLGPSGDANLRLASTVCLASCAVFSMVTVAAHVLICTFFMWVALALCCTAFGGGTVVGAFQMGRRARTALVGAWCAACAVLAVAFAAHFTAAVFTCRATVAIGEGRHRDAVGDLARALALEPHNPVALYQRAHTLVAAGESRSALAYYRKVLDTDPYFENVHYNMGALHLANGDFDSATARLSIAVRQFPDFVDGLYFLAKSHHLAGRQGDCLHWCDRTLRARPGDLRALRLRAVAVSMLKATHDGP